MREGTLQILQDVFKKKKSLHFAKKHFEVK